jgi:hypothetical protein
MAKKKICKVARQLIAEETAKTLQGHKPDIIHDRICCCLCKHHYELSSHPWVNRQSGKLGYVCVMHDGKYAMLVNEHFVGGCELFEEES